MKILGNTNLGTITAGSVVDTLDTTYLIMEFNKYLTAVDLNTNSIVNDGLVPVKMVVFLKDNITTLQFSNGESHIITRIFNPDKVSLKIGN